MINFYEILNVPENATAREIQKAYRSLAKLKHPDVCNEENATEEFQKISDAYKVLSDDELRKEYDEQFRGVNQQDYRFDKAFESILEKMKNRKVSSVPVRGRTYQQDLPVTIEQIMKEETVQFSCEIEQVCSTCTGDKVIFSGEICSTCNGSGGISEVISTPFGKIKQKASCGSCLGTGRGKPENCSSCAGEGVKKTTFNKEIKLQNHYYFGVTLIYRGFGGDGLNGGENGDIIIELTQKTDPRYGLEYGNNIINFTFVTLEEMLLGEDVEIEMPDGTYETIKIPDYSLNPQNKMTFAGKGMMNEKGQRGIYTTSLIVDFSKIDEDKKKKIVQILGRS